MVLFAGCLKDEDLKLKTYEYQPVELNDGWQTDTVTGNNFNVTAFDELVQEVYSEDKNLFIRSLLIVYEGKLLAEMYPKDMADRDEPHQLWSATKSFVSLLTGIAIDKGYIEDVNDSIFRYLPEYIQYVSNDYLDITIEHCLTMYTGINYDNDGEEEEELLARVPDDLTKYILERPLHATPGTEMFYKNSDPQLLIKVVSNASNADFVGFADTVLFEPLGIHNYFWSRNKDNTPYGGFGLWLTPRDLAKTGLLLLNEGMWEGNRIISNQWITEATSFKTNSSYGHDYGYLIWLDDEEGMYWFWGKGGQFLFVIPGKQLVIVITSEQFADNGGTSIQEALAFVNTIVSNVR